MTPEDILARLLYRDGLMLVVDKPAGLAVHKGPKGGASFEDHFGALKFGLPRAPALAHRLDRDTSGCLVLGRHRKALAELGRLFKQGRVGKTYWALVEGGPAENEGTIDLPLGRRDAKRGWWMKPDEKGQPATTIWRVLGRSWTSSRASATGPGPGAGDPGPITTYPSATESSVAMGPGSRGLRPLGRDDNSNGLTWLALEPMTGRTHQLRVHCAEKGWPIVGDAIYGTAPRTGGPPLQLHAREVIVPLYKNRDAIRVTAPVPAHMREWLTKCGWKSDQ
jgi:tRNA pseudouridine32 synthase/23S rRNA pseudouridine746 synthase